MGLVKFFSAWGDRKNAALCFARSLSTHVDTMLVMLPMLIVTKYEVAYVLLHTAYVFGADEIALNPKYDEYQWGLASMMSKIFHTKIGSGVNVNEVLAQELHKPVIKKSLFKV